jgi:hypothetical protein
LWWWNEIIIQKCQVNNICQPVSHTTICPIKLSLTVLWRIFTNTSSYQVSENLAMCLSIPLSM